MRVFNVEPKKSPERNRCRANVKRGGRFSLGCLRSASYELLHRYGKMVGSIIEYYGTVRHIRRTRCAIRGDSPRGQLRDASPQSWGAGWGCGCGKRLCCDRQPHLQCALPAASGNRSSGGKHTCRNPCRTPNPPLRRGGTHQIRSRQPSGICHVVP